MLNIKTYYPAGVSNIDVEYPTGAHFLKILKKKKNYERMCYDRKDAAAEIHGW